MLKTLRELYPFVREKSEILKDIMETPELKEMYDGWDKEHQEHFLDFCSGAKGVKMLHDGFFKEILDPDSKPQRLEELLSLLLKEEVKILHVLPNDSSRIADESSLLIMDIVVQLANGSIANVECQRIGYLFMGQRAACYSADLLLRQYKRVRDERKKKFLYKDVKKVYSIIFYEKSPIEFLAYSEEITHYFRQMSNTGLELELLQEYVFIPLDIANQIYQNKGVADSKLEAWLVFLSNDDPEVIAKLISNYPEFEEMYQEVYDVCKNTKQVMNMFSEELRIMDRNTVQYMVDEMQETIDKQLEQLQQKMNQLERNAVELEQKDAQLERNAVELEQKDAQLERNAAELEQKDAQLERNAVELEQKDAEIQRLKEMIAELQK